MSGSAKDTVEEEALRRFDSSFRYLHGKALGHFLHLGRKSLDILTRIQYSCINKSSCLVFSLVLSALPVQLPMPGCLPLIAAILMQKFPGSVKLTCPENQCHIMRRLENWKHEDLAATGYIYNLYHYIWQRRPGWSLCSSEGETGCVREEQCCVRGRNIYIRIVGEIYASGIW